VFGLEYDLDLFNIVAVPDFNMYDQMVDSVTLVELIPLQIYSVHFSFSYCRYQTNWLIFARFSGEPWKTRVWM